MMKYWLFKSEPYKFSWDEQVEKGAGRWEKRVRNYQARNNMKDMAVGDQAFFYHSGEGREIVGIVEIIAPHYPDPDDETGKFVTVDVKPVRALSKPVTLKEMKAEDALQDMRLIRQVRLSVCPVTEAEWAFVNRMSAR